MIPVDENIKEQFCKVIAYSQGEYFASPNDVNPADIFQRWADDKEFFYHAFGEQLIYEVPETVRFELSQQDKENRFNEFLNYINEYDVYGDLINFLLENKDGFYTNTVLHDFQPSWQNDIIKKGSKLVRAFKYFVSGYDLNNFQTRASRLIQEEKAEGKLCFSIHPLDYLSISETSFNWRSCHALDGDYRSGNLNYMADKSTVVCYLKSEHDEQLPNFPFCWNSKKWRVLLFFSEDMSLVFAGRQYPFSNEVGLKIILENLNNLMYPTHNGKAKYINWKRNYIKTINPESLYPRALNYSYFEVCGNLYPMEEIVVNGKKTNHYNDLYNSTYYHNPYYSYLYWKDYTDEFWENAAFPYAGDALKQKGEYTPKAIKIGRQVKCLHCNNNVVIESSRMVCDDCDNLTTCQECGSVISVSDAFYIDGYSFCKHCFEKICEELEDG